MEHINTIIYTCITKININLEEYIIYKTKSTQTIVDSKA